jgi:death-on-curing protein
MISTEQVIKIHEILVEKFGGAKGLRDLALLESALSRPYQTFGGIELHENQFQKAAAIIQSLLINHPFVDGNKRIGYVVMRLILLEKGWELNVTQDDKYQFVIRIAEGKMEFNEISDWIKSNAIRISNE